MPLEEEVKRVGAKGATLEYIRQNCPLVPIAPYVLVPVGYDWKDYRTEISGLGSEVLARSSSPLEDGKNLSFAGLFDTVKFKDDSDVDLVFQSTKSPATLRYAQIHGITGPIDMGLVFQTNTESSWNWGMLRHPHRRNILFIMGRPVPDPYRNSKNLVFDEKTMQLFDIYEWSLFDVYGHRKPEPQEPSGQILQAIQAYCNIEKLPEFQNGYAYHMEFGTSPFSVYQFRPFRKVQEPTWRIPSNSLEEIGAIRYPVSFGITPEEGVELSMVRAWSQETYKEEITEFRECLNKGMPINTAIRRWQSKFKDISKPEIVYAEEFAKKNPETAWYYHPSDAIDRALEKLNSARNRESTLLYQQNIHYAYGRDIDLVFPNARAWIAEGGLQFLSHNWFRAMQSYDFAFGGYSKFHGKTGDNVRIYCDGVHGAIVPTKKE